MARTFQDVLNEVTAKSDPQRKLVLDQVAALPTQQAADEAGLEAKKTQAFDEILGGARRRGLGFSGIPVGEQAKYAATDYAPALANLKAGYGARRGTLESALADIGRSDYMSAQDIFGRDRAFEEQQRQFDLQQRAAAAAAQFTPTTQLPQQAVMDNRPSLDDIFRSYNPNIIPLVGNSAGSTIPLGVTKPLSQPRLSVARPMSQPTLRVR